MLCGEDAGVEGIANTKSPHEILKAGGFARKQLAIRLIALGNGKISFAGYSPYGFAIHGRIMLTIPGERLLQKLRRVALLAPEASADQAGTVDN